MGIRRYLVLVGALVAMGLGTVWWKTQTLGMGYEVVRLERERERAEEEERLEDSLLSGLTSPERVQEKVKELKLRLSLQGRVIVAPRGRRGDARRRSVAMVRGR